MRSLVRELRSPIRTVILMLAVAALVAACGGGGREPPTDDPPVPESTGEPTPEPAPDPTPEPTPEPAPVDTPEEPVVMPACVETVLGCLQPDKYEEELQTREHAHGDNNSFATQWGLASMRADRAYAQLELEHGIDLEPGAGQTVGLIDSGIDQGHPVFAGKAVSEVFFGGAGDETGDSYSHGTAVASVMAAGRGVTFDGGALTAAHGVAWGADIAAFAIPTGRGSGVYRPIRLTGLTVDDIWASRLEQILSWSSAGGTLDFINVSVGYLGIIEQYSEQMLRDAFSKSLELVAQSGETDKAVFIWSAGNAHGDPCDPSDFAGHRDLCEAYVDGNNETGYRVNAKSVELFPGLPARIPELRGNLVAVVAVGPDSDGDGSYEIADFSNRCGIARDWCIAAPGVDVRVAYFGPFRGVNGYRGVAESDGTSFAAPMVTGALAVMKHHFRDELSNTGLVSRLFATAYDQGIYADSAIYGHGLLDLAAALSPQGTPRVSLGARVEDSGVDLDLTRLSLGSPLGDGMTQALAGQEIAAFDDLGAPFWYALDSLTDASPGPWAGARLQRFMTQPETGQQTPSWRPALGVVENIDAAGGASPLRLSRLEAPPVGAAAGHLSLAGRAVALRTAGQGDYRVAAFSTEGLDGQAPTSGATLAWRPEGSPLGVRGGWVGEREAMLGSAAAGAFGRMAAGSAFVGVEGSARLGAWRLGAGAEVGTVNGAVDGGLIADVSPLRTSAFGVRADRPLADGGTLTLTLSQPLRVEAGRARLSVPVGRTKDGLVRRRAVTAGLEPTGREIEVAARWHKALSMGGELRLGAAWTRHPGHAAGADPDITLLAGWRHAF